MNKLLILLLLSTPLLAEDIRIENKILENSEVEMIFMSDGNYHMQMREFDYHLYKGVWERDENSINIYIKNFRCSYWLKQIADTYVFLIQSVAHWEVKKGKHKVCDDQFLMKETEWSKANYNIINAIFY